MHYFSFRRSAMMLLFMMFSVTNLYAGHAQSYTILHNFGDGSVANDGLRPTALTQGRDGDFYGVTASGGSVIPIDTAGNGTIYKMTPRGAETILHDFGQGAADGSVPNGPLVQGTDGNFYGTTTYGGSTATPGDPYSGTGTVFKISPSGAYVILHSFRAGNVAGDGEYPTASPVEGRDGSFYGTTQDGGSGGGGVIYKITPSGAYTLLHDFGDGSVANDGALPQAPLVLGDDGNFYGTTPAGGGTIYEGTVFKMTPSGVVTILHRFSLFDVPNAGFNLQTPLIPGHDGNFYGSASNGGLHGYGTVFQLTPAGTVTVLHDFGSEIDGYYPGAPVEGRDGCFYGSTFAGGASVLTDNGYYGYGALYKITSDGEETILHDFGDRSVLHDGIQGGSPLIQGQDGAFYGTTSAGGTDGGTIFRMLLPSAPPPAALLSLTPASVQAESFPFSLTLTGTGFTPATSVTWNVTPLAAKYVSATEIIASVPTSLLVTPATISITAHNPKAIPSNSLTETITLGVFLTSIYPATARAGSAALSITVTGEDFVPGAVVSWNGAPLRTHYLNTASVTAEVPASDLATPVVARVTIANPRVLPSGAQTFTVTP